MTDDPPSPTELPFRPRLLFVDAQPQARRYFESMFSNEYDVLLAANVNEAIALLDRLGSTIAVLVTDQTRAGSGVDLLVYAESRFPLITRIVTDPGLEAGSASATAHRRIDKPWDWTELREQLRAAFLSHLDETRKHELVQGRRLAQLSLAAAIAHEVRTPLASIKLGMSALLKAWPDIMQGYQAAVDAGLVDKPLRPRLTSVLNTLAQKTNTEVDQANMVINAMLLAASDPEQLSQSLKPLSIRECIDSAIERFPFKPRQRELVTIDARSDFMFNGRTELFVYVFYNLLRNSLYALSARTEADPSPGTITITVTRTGTTPMVTVRDTGIGIPNHIIPFIFDDSFTTRPAGVGNGLGLPFCKRVMQAIGGDITLESVVGRETTVTLLFPDNNAAAASPPAAQPPAE